MPACEWLVLFNKTRGLKRKKNKNKHLEKKKKRENNTSRPALGLEFIRLWVTEVGQAG